MSRASSLLFVPAFVMCATACFVSIKDVPDPSAGTGTSSGGTSGGTSGTSGGSSGTSGGSSGTSGGNLEDLTGDAKTDFVNATCTQTQTCLGVLFLSVYADQADCRARFGQLVGEVFDLDGAPDAQALNACTTSLRTARQKGSCDIAQCARLTGRLGANAECVAHEQCSSGVCFPDVDNGLCGHCKPAPNEGEQCINESCGPSLHCYSVTSANGGAPTCYRPRQRGERCTNALLNEPCAEGLACENGTCGDPVKGLASACHDFPGCDPAANLLCDFSSGGNVGTCTAYGFNEVENPCGPVGATGYTACRYSTCQSGTCVAATACDDVGCAPPLKCWNGECQAIPAPASCSYR